MKWVSVNGILLEASRASIAVDNPAFHFGHGIFETIRIEEGKPLRFDRHWQRLEKSAQELSIPLRQDKGTTLAHANELIKRNGLMQGALKLIAYGGESPSIVLLMREQNYTEAQYTRGFRLTIASEPRFSKNQLLRHKSCNYLSSRLARSAANEAGFDEAIFFNENNQLCEGSFTNIFFVKNQTLHTPSLECGLLPGIMRAEVIDWAQREKYPYKEGSYSIEDVLCADEVFVTNALIGVMPVSFFGEKPFDLTQPMLSMALAKTFSSALSPRPGVEAFF